MMLVIGGIRDGDQVEHDSKIPWLRLTKILRIPVAISSADIPETSRIEVANYSVEQIRTGKETYSVLLHELLRPEDMIRLLIQNYSPKLRRLEGIG